MVNILGIQARQNPYHWLNVYDEDKCSAKISQTHLLAPSNTPEGLAGLQVEVYASPYRPSRESHEDIPNTVTNEVLALGLLDETCAMHFHFVLYANINFDHHRREDQDVILSFLACHGLVREAEDLDLMTDWTSAHKFSNRPLLALAGRFGQWKYF